MFVGVNYDEKDSKGRNAIQVAKDNNASAAVSVLVKLSQDQLKLFHYFSYVYLMFWVSVYVVYHEYIFLETIENFTVSILFNFTFLWLGPLYVYFLFRLCKCYNPAFIQAPGEQVQELVQEKFDKSLFDEIPDINDFCVTCSVKRPIRSKHCRFLDKCILDYDHFSLFLGKSIGRGNRKTYYLWVLFNFFALACFLYLNWRFLHDMTRETGYFSSYLAEIVVCFVDMPGAYKVVVFVAWLLTWYSFCYSFLLGFCVSQGLTVNETLNRHRYRYLFESFEDDGNKKMRFRNPFNKGCFQNFVTFFMS
jgi:palmitoyltransferase